MSVLRIKEVLSEKGVTGKQLAEKMGVTPQYISGIVRGTNSASIDVLLTIAKHLEVPIASLFADYDKGMIAKCPKCGLEFDVDIKPRRNV